MEIPATVAETRNTSYTLWRETFPFGGDDGTLQEAAGREDETPEQFSVGD